MLTPQNPTILVTGGAGYIGSHTALLLEQAGYDVIILDNMVYGHRDIIQPVLQAKIIEGDISDRPLLDHIFATHPIQAVIHFAAYAYVGESVTEPTKYYRNNVGGTMTLLEAMLAASVKNIVFSSTCATYGVPDMTPIPEDHPQKPINPYGASKLMVERMLTDLGNAFGLNSVIFRYFNAAGAHPSGLLGEDHNPETHLIPLVLQTALELREAISIFGSDYPTKDGTCVRDYIHVVDLAEAHILGLKHLLRGGQSEIFNLSNGNGFSVREVIEVGRKVTGRPIRVIECDRRPGDPPILIGRSDKAREMLGWHPQYPDLSDIMAHAWAWHQKRHQPVVASKKQVLQPVLVGGETDIEAAPAANEDYLAISRSYLEHLYENRSTLWSQQAGDIPTLQRFSKVINRLENSPYYQEIEKARSAKSKV